MVVEDHFRGSIVSLAATDLPHVGLVRGPALHIHWNANAKPVAGHQ
jgi:hypothetical protein